MLSSVVNDTFIGIYQSQSIVTPYGGSVTILKFVVFAASAAMMFGCGSPANTNTAIVNTNVNTAPMNTNVTAASPAVPAAESTVEFSLATPSDAYRTAYAIREKKDVAGMKKVLSKDVIEFLEMMAEVEKKTLNDQIAEMFLRPQAKTAETRNEKIKGNRATIEYLDEEGNWDIMDFVKDGQDWKLALPDKDSPENKPANK